MADEKAIPEESFDAEIYTLTDEDGKELEFELLGELTENGVKYMAMTPLEEDNDEYVILKLVRDENGDDMLETVDDDDEFERIADAFDDLFAEDD